MPIETFGVLLFVPFCLIVEFRRCWLAIYSAQSPNFLAKFTLPLCQLLTEHRHQGCVERMVACRNAVLVQILLVAPFNSQT